MDIQELLIQLLDKGVNASGLEVIAENDVERRTLGYVLNGVPKSGTATLYLNNAGEIICKTRYNQLDKVNSIKDVVDVVFRWWVSYRSRTDYIGSEWMELFIEYDLVNPITHLTYEPK